MTHAEADQLAPGLYRVFWVEGGLSVAAVGHDEEGRAWLAPTNWLRPWAYNGKHALETWQAVERVELITTQAEEQRRAFP